MGGVGRGNVEGDLVGDADAVAFQGDHLFGVVGQDADVFQAEVDQDLRAYAAFVLHHALAGRLAIQLAALVEVDLGKGAGCFGCFDAEAAAGVVKIEKDAAVFVRDGRQGAGDEFGAIAGDGAKDVPGQAVGMHADERRRRAFQVAANQRYVLVVIDIARVGDHAEIAEARGENGFGYAANVTLVLHAVADQVRHR